MAGLRVDGKGWVRPIATDTDHGQLYSRHYRLENRTDPEILDVIRVDLAKPQPSPGQPENWTIGGKGWVLVTRPIAPALYKVFHAALATGPALLGNTERRVGVTHTAKVPASLALIAPSRIRVFLERDRYDRLQSRVLFELGGNSYNLPITDPAWTSRIVRKLAQLEDDTYYQETIGISRDSKVLFTVSLSEAFQGYYYKLVAGIVVLP